MEEAYPLKGASSSQHRIDILPVWHPQRGFIHYYYYYCFNCCLSGVFKWVMLFISCLFSVGSYFTYDMIMIHLYQIKKISYFNFRYDSIGVVEEDIEEVSFLFSHFLKNIKKERTNNYLSAFQYH